MIIKHPETENIPALTKLWMQAFGDAEDFIKIFFATGYADNRCMLCLEDDTVVAALYWFDCSWGSKKLAYLYAIATDENHQGKGICTELMKHTHRHLQEQGYAGALLMPAEESLEVFYGKMGYGRITPPAFSDDSRQKTASWETITPEEYLTLRQQYLPKGGVQHTLPALRYLSHFAKFYRFPGGICCGDPELPMEYLPGYPGDPAMYLSLDGTEQCPTYFALPLA